MPERSAHSTDPLHSTPSGNAAGSPESPLRWTPAAGPLLTRWAAHVRPEAPLPEYPRPQQVRGEWLNLNGLWHYAIRPRQAARPDPFDGLILVPFPVESALSGVMKPVGESDQVWYRRTFKAPLDWRGRRILLHFGAVDWQAQVWVNGKKAGEHQGGFDPFSLDITTLLFAGRADQELVVAVWDPTDKSTQPRGKQVLNPHGIWYTPVTGIWQTVWLEPAPETFIAGLKITPDVDANEVRVAVTVDGTPEDYLVYLKTHAPSDDPLDDRPVRVDAWGEPGKPIVLTLPDSPAPRLWSPESPYLYDLQVSLHRRPDNETADGEAADTVASYFGMRKVSLGKDRDGVTRLCLNNQPVFMFGPLDQGFWPDGIYTAPTDEALRHDVEITRAMAFNMARKHIKIEPDRWYHWCDRLGLLVWQDMPSGDAYVDYGKGEITRTPESAARYDHELQRMIDTLYNHPSIVMWVPFNEGWGQFDTARVAKWTREYDPSRLVDSASGWNDVGAGDVHDIHAYPEPNSPPLEERRAAVLGEFGGLGFPVPGHMWQKDRNWGYRELKSPEDLAADYASLLVKLGCLIRFAGLSAAVYTQTTDVEGEVNGLLTYDRAHRKIDLDRLAAMNNTAYAAFNKGQARIRFLAPDAWTGSSSWRFTTTQPDDDWFRPGFDDSAWSKGSGGFGGGDTQGPAPVQTPWESGNIWLRRAVELAPAPLRSPHLILRYKEAAEVYLNGVLALRISGWAAQYFIMPVSPEAAATLKPGANLLAIACRQGPDGRYIDAGLVDVIE